jgi:DNA-binding CsgD family transcriptional regulator/tetratricopeptide (TPR) repeat protein
MPFVHDVTGGASPGERNALLGPFVVRRAPAVPRRTLRLRALEATLSELTSTQRVVWLRAPSRSGKRTAVATWIRHSRTPRQVTWLVHDPAQAQARGHGRSLEHLLGIRDAASDDGAPRDPARASRLFVVDVGAARVSAADVEAVRRLALRHSRTQLVIVSDADYAVLDEGSADVESNDFRIPEDVLRSEFASHGVSLTELTVRSLAGYADDPALISAFLAAELEHPTLDERDILRMARARTIATLVKRVAPRDADDLLMILTLLPRVDERVLGAYDGVPEAFIALARRRLIAAHLSEDASISYALPDELREVMRSALIGHYLAHRERLHRTAAAIAVDGGDFVEAVAQYLTIPDVTAAMGVFRDHWSDAPLNLPRAAAMLEKLPADELTTDLESAAASWLVRLGAEGRAPRGAVELVLQQATPREIARLDLTGRLSVRTARTMSHLDRHEAARAAQTVAEGLEDLDRAPLSDHGALGHVYSSFLLAAARSSVYRGAVSEASGRYAEVLALPEAAERSINTYWAHVGRALTLTVNGELDTAQSALDSAAAIAEEHGGGQHEWGRVALWCQGMIWSLSDRDELLDTLFEDHARSGAFGDASERRRMGAALRAQALLRKGFAAEAVALARRAADSGDTGRDHPLISQWTTSVLGLALTASGQPGAALALTAGIPPNSDHAPCLHAVRAFASVAAGDPRGALQATDECVGMQSSHAKLPLAEVFLARSFAFEALGLSNAAEDAYLSALGLASHLGVRISLDPASNRTIERLHRRSRERAPLLVGGALQSGMPGAGQPLVRVLPQLSDQERRVLQYLMTPLTIVEIGDILYVSRNTVKTHIRNIYRKLKVQSRKQAEDVAAASGLHPAPPARRSD